MKNLENRSTYALFPANGFLTIFIFSNLFDRNLLFKDRFRKFHQAVHLAVKLWRISNMDE